MTLHDFKETYVKLVQISLLTLTRIE